MWKQSWGGARFGWCSNMATELPKPKYRNRCMPGPASGGGQRIYDSVKEANYAADLELRRRFGDIADWKPRIRIPLGGPGSQRLVALDGARQACYVADFLVIRNDGSPEVHEVKGFDNGKDPVTRVWKLKVGLVACMWPDVRTVTVWQHPLE